MITLIKSLPVREEGFWFYNKDVPTYITGTHYMYLQWSKIDVGAPDFSEANRLFFIFWEACKADSRSYGMCYLKNRRSGFSFMASGEVVNLATISSDSRYGILSKSGADAKKMFTDKVVPISVNYPFFFKPIQDGMDRPKTELAYRVPASKFTRRSITSTGDEALDRSSRVLTPPSTGRIPATTPTMGRSSNSSYMMNRVNGRSRTTFSTTGGLRKPH